MVRGNDAVPACLALQRALMCVGIRVGSHFLRAVCIYRGDVIGRFCGCDDRKREQNKNPAMTILRMISSVDLISDLMIEG
jgi:hypothetical protein